MSEEKRVSEGAVLYLLGAGASAKALPVSGAMEKSMEDFANEWHRKIDAHIAGMGDERVKYEDYKKEFFQEIEWARGIARRYGSFDTYARQLSIRKDISNLRRVKVFLSAFFLAIQGTRGIDYRYDMFFGDTLKAESNPL